MKKEKLFRKGTGIAGLIAAAALCASAFALPVAASADNEPGQTGSGANGEGNTALKIQSISDGTTEYSESGTNVSFTFPSQINYVVKADGSLIGPSKSSTYLENESTFAIHVSSIKTEATNPWNFIETIANAGTTANSVELNLGPDAQATTPTKSINIANFTSKTAGTDNMPVAKAEAWGMGAGGKIEIDSKGAVANVTQDITSITQFGTVQWYVKSGPAPTS